MNRSRKWAAFVALVVIVVAVRGAAFLYYAFAHPVTGVGAAAAASAPIRQPAQNQ